VLHHNDPEGLRQTFQEAYRVLKPGGRLLVINETLKALRDPVGVHTEEVERFAGYEHAYWAWRYRWEATRTGFMTRVLAPPYWWPFDASKVAPPPRARDLKSRAAGAGLRLLTSRIGRRAYTMYLNHVDGSVQLNMIATKPQWSLRRAQDTHA
jgi:SAM-dependent methyltransferase